MKTSQRQSREDDIVDAQRRLDEHKTGPSKTALKLPPEVQLYRFPIDPKTKTGVARLDIIPFRIGPANKRFAYHFADEGKLFFEQTYFAHRNLGPDGKSSYVCILQTFGKPCPICDHVNKLWKNYAQNKAEISSYKSTQRQLFNVIDLDDRDAGVQLLDYSNYLFGQHLDAKIRNADDDDREKYVRFASVKSGMSLRIGCAQSTKGDMTMITCADIEFRDRKQTYDMDIVDQAYQLDEIPIELSGGQLLKLLTQGEEPQEPQETERKTSHEDNGRASGRSSSSRTATVDEDEEEVQEPSDTEEEENTSSRKTGTGKKNGKDSEDEEPEPKTTTELGLKIGTSVTHKKYGECEIISIAKDKLTVTIEDEDGIEHPNVKAEACKKHTPKPKDEEEDEDED
jgi:hypothetical protein